MKRFLISEAVRGEGAILRDHRGRAFMEGYHPLKDLAPRDIVARAIDSEMKKTGASHVWLDCSRMSDQTFKQRFPNIYTACEQMGIYPPRISFL